MNSYGMEAYDSEGDRMSWFVWDTPDLVLGFGIIIIVSHFNLNRCPCLENLLITNLSH